jgi:hypothetical protein
MLEMICEACARFVLARVLLENSGEKNFGLDCELARFSAGLRRRRVGFARAAFLRYFAPLMRGAFGKMG